MTIGERIRQRRLELELTQDELAKRMGYTTRTAISNVEKGKEDLTTTRVRKFAEALNVSPSYLMGWEEERHDTTLFIPFNTTDDERILLEQYRCLPDEDREQVSNTIKRLFHYWQIFNEATGKENDSDGQ